MFQVRWCSNSILQFANSFHRWRWRGPECVFQRVLFIGHQALVDRRSLRFGRGSLGTGTEKETCGRANLTPLKKNEGGPVNWQLTYLFLHNFTPISSIPFFFLYQPNFPPLAAILWTPLMCWWRPCLEVNLASQAVHEKGFSPMCCLSCALKAVSLFKLFSQCVHLNIGSSCFSK